MLIRIKSFLIILIFTCLIFAQPSKSDYTLTPEMLRMAREKISFNDNQLRLFNGRGSIYTERYSLTGLHKITFPPLDMPLYHFHLDFFHAESNTLIRDDVPAMWEEWKKYQTGSDPLGSNFRPGFATVLVSQDEYWEPNLYHRKGTFHKEYNGRMLSFAIETEARVSGSSDEVYLKIIIVNREHEDLSLVLVPRQAVDVQPGRKNDIFKKDRFTITNGEWNIRVSSDIQKTADKGWVWEIPAGKSAAAHFVISPQKADEKIPDLYQGNISSRMKQAAEHTCERLNSAAAALPKIETENKTLNEFYNRCILSVIESKWERENFIISPFWAVGTWLFTITWDNSFFADMLSMMDPKSMRETILTAMREGKMECTYVGWNGGGPGIVYIQEPFALRIMIDAYLRQTGDIQFLDETAAGRTVFEWMKEWTAFLYAEYRSPHSGLIDMGQGTEELIEIRTDGYNYVVPVVNGLTVELQNWLADWCEKRNDPDSTKLRRQADELEQKIHQRLWNPQQRWFDNLYADGSRKAVFTNHLFDLVGTNVLTPEEFLGMISHLNDNEFLGPYNMYSISRQDKVHWDLIDSDWGGGGAFAGMPLRLARDLYKNGQGTLAWTILQRFSRYTEFFPYLGQNMRANEPLQDESSMPLQVSAGAGVEAVLFGMFGLEPHADGTLDIRPFYHYDVGRARMNQYLFRGHRYDLDIDAYGFTLFRDGRKFGSFQIGRKIRILPDGRIIPWEKLQAASPFINIREFYFINEKEVILASASDGAKIHYTLDGSEPGPGSPEYVSPIQLIESTLIKARAFVKDRIPSPVSEMYVEKLVFRDESNPDNVINSYPYPEIIPQFKLSEHHKPEYGFYTILDGKQGSSSYADGQWIGQEAGDIELIIKWPEAVPVHKISTRFLVNYQNWVFLPQQVEIEVSSDNSNFISVGKKVFTTEQDNEPNMIQDFKISFEKTMVRSLKLKAKNIKVCPDWHHGAKGKAWIFMDEIIIQ